MTRSRSPMETPILDIDTGGHKAKIKDVMFTKDGKYLVSASDDKTVRVWDVNTGETVRVIRGQIGEGHEGKIFAAALSPDNHLLAVGGWMAHGFGIDDDKVGNIRLINFQTGEVTTLLKGHSAVINGLAFSSDSRYLISGSGLGDLTARIWDVRSGKTLRELEGHTDNIYAVAFSPDGSRAVTGSDDHTLKLWKVSSGSLIATLEGHTDDVVSAAFTPDGKYILSGSWDKTIRLWDGKTGKFIKVLATQDSRVASLSISPDGTKVVTGCGSHPLTNNVFSIPSGKRLTSFSKHKNIVLTTAVSPDGTTAATGGGSDQEIYLWDINTAQVKRKMVGKGKVVWSVGFAKNGLAIAWGKTWEQDNRFSYGPLEQSFKLKDDRNFRLTMGKTLSGDTGYQRAIESVGSLSICTENGESHPTLQISKNGEVIHEITRDSTDGYHHQSLTLTLDGQTVISGGGNGVLTSYNPKTGEIIHDFIGHTADVWGVAASPDSRLLVSGSVDQTIRLWEIESGKLLLTVFHGTDNEWVAWTPAGYYTSSSIKADDYIGWHINQGADKEALYYPASRFSKQFYSPEIVARYLETGGDIDKAIRLANADKPKEKQTEKTEITDIPQMIPPAVFFQVPTERDMMINDEYIQVKVLAKSVTQEPVTDFWLQNNEKRVSQDNDIRFIGRNSLQAEIDITVRLSSGRNSISAVAVNKDTRSNPEVIRVIYSETQDVQEIANESKEEFNDYQAVLQRKIADGKFDVFLCHNGADKEEVKEIGKRLKECGILPWLDEWEIPPFVPWIDELQKIINQINSAAVFVGSSGTGPWEDIEMKALLVEFGNRNIRLGPVLLPGCPRKPELPLFLNNFHWVDFRKNDPDPLEQLVWGITGEKGGLG